MTVSTLTSSNAYQANGVTTVFPYTFRILVLSDLKISTFDSAGTETPVASGFTVSGVGFESGGNVTFTNPPANGLTVLVYRDVPLVQPTDYKNQGPFYGRTHESSFDRATMQIQQLFAASDRALRVSKIDGPIADLLPASVRANKLMAFDDLGDPTTALPVADSSTELRADLASSMSLKGAKIVGYRNGATDALPRTADDALGESLSVLDFIPLNLHVGIAAGGETTDLAAYIQKARDWLASGSYPRRLRWPSGRYYYSASPNWAIPDAQIVAEGEVRLRYTGTGNAVILDAGSGSQNCYNTQMGNFIVEAPSGSMNAVFSRGVHHGKLAFKVRGAGTTYAGLRVEFGVCTEFDITCSVNEAIPDGGWYSKPLNGIVLTRRGVGETASACLFTNPIIEGVGGDGIVLDYAIKNVFTGGTSEGNTGLGVKCSTNSSYNSFNAIDLEVNTGGGLEESGRSNSYTDVLNSDLTTITSSAYMTRLTGGLYDAILDDGLGTVLDQISYGANSGLITGAGTFRTKRNVFYLVGNSLDFDKSSYSLANTLTSCPNNTATTVLQLPTTGNRMLQIAAYIPAVGAATLFGGYAVIYQDMNTARIMTQVNGPDLVISLSGMNVQVTQTAGSTQNVAAIASAL